jgi:hypothetical protein
VEIGDARRTVDDPERRCLERARVAAVFIALNVPKPEPPASPSVSTAPSAAPLPPSPAPASETWLSVQAEAELAVASTKLVAPGAGLGIALHHVPWRFALDAGIVSSVELGDEQKGTASLSRVPIALTAAYLVRAGSFDVGPHAGLALDVLYARGRDVPGADAGTRANFGAELGILARWRAVDRLGLVATLGASLFPGRYELRIEPTGALAMTPRHWATSTIGIFWDFRDSEPPVP